MKLFLVLIICLLSSISSLAQTSETFDLATFRPPTGWQRQSKEGVLIFTTSDSQKGTYALLSLYRSGQSSGDARRDFDSDWQQFIVGQLGVKGEPQLEPIKNAQGWDVITGGTVMQNEMGRSAVILHTFSGFGKTFSMTAIFNSQDHLAAIEAFVFSLKLKKPDTTSQPTPAVNNASDTSSILGTWGKSSGVHMTYGDPVSAGMAGYSKDQYTFNANGTYSFVSKTFRMAYDKIILVIENGTYQINGETITIKPQKSVIQAWSKQNGGDHWGRLLSSQNRTLETVNYRFTRHYFSGIQLWNLVLQAGNPTERDGPFSNNTLFPNAWYYAPISANNPVIELPR